MTNGACVKYSAYQEAIKNREGLEQSLINAAARYSYFQSLLANTAQPIPTLDPLDQSALTKKKLNVSEPTIAQQQINIDIAQALGADGGIPISSYEAEELKDLATAHGIQEAVHLVENKNQLFEYFLIDPGMEPVVRTSRAA